MNRNKKWFLSALSGFSILTASLTYPHANSLSVEQQTMQQLQNEATQTYHQISRDHSQAQALQTSIHSYATSIANVKESISQNQTEMVYILQSITTLTRKITENQKTLTLDKTTLDNQIRATYENGNGPYLSVLFGATSFDDLLTRLQMLSTISNAQKALLHHVQTLQAKIVAQHVVQQQKYNDLTQHQQQLQLLRQTDAMIESKQQHSFLDLKVKMTNETRKRTLLESQIQLTKSQILQIQLETQQAEQLMRNQAYVQSAKRSLVNVNSSDLIKFAEGFMGLPYVWGGTGTSGFDCSGFTQYVYAHFGDNLYRTSEQQFAEGVPITQSQLQPGDLVFFSTYAPGASHVGIYIGNGLMVDSEDVGVAIDGINNSYWGPKYIGARRVIK